MYGRTNTKGKSLKKLTALFADDFFVKKGLCTKGAETQLGKKLIWPPKIFLSQNTGEVIFAAAPMLFSNTPRQHHQVRPTIRRITGAVTLRINKVKLTSPPLSAQL
jgi:hypothetical protein